MELNSERLFFWCGVPNLLSMLLIYCNSAFCKMVFLWCEAKASPIHMACIVGSSVVMYYLLMWGIPTLSGPEDLVNPQFCHDNCLFPGSKQLSNDTKSGSANNTTPTSGAEGSAIWRLRTGREKWFLLLLRLLLSIAVVIVMDSNFWT